MVQIVIGIALEVTAIALMYTFYANVRSIQNRLDDIEKYIAYLEAQNVELSKRINWAEKIIGYEWPKK